jgi:hypothetical protein
MSQEDPIASIGKRAVDQQRALTRPATDVIPAHSGSTGTQSAGANQSGAWVPFGMLDITSISGFLINGQP